MLILSLKVFLHVMVFGKNRQAFRKVKVMTISIFLLILATFPFLYSSWLTCIYDNRMLKTACTMDSEIE